MTTPVDPRRTEPPAGTEDILLAEFLDEAIGRMGRGEPVSAPQLLAMAPHLVEGGQSLLQNVQALLGAASRVRQEDLLLESELQDLSAEERSGVPEFSPEKLPNPFPGEFRVLRFLDKGAFGAVWLAEDLNLARPVALKTIYGSGTSRLDDQKLARLRDEARLLGAIRHRNIVHVYAWRETTGQGAAGGSCYLILQYVPGGSLATRVREEGPLPWSRAARYVADVAEGLLEMHAQGIVHRDVKPANILWDPEGDEALLTDLGISARLAGGAGVAGSPFYMPPEAFAGQVSPAQDVYGLTATLFWLVTGSVPFPGSTREQIIEQARLGLPDPDPRCTDFPQALEKLVRRGLAADPSRRPSLREFAANLRGTLNQLLADSLLCGAPATVVEHLSERLVPLRLTVSRQVGRETFAPVATSRPEPERFVRDLRRVPPHPDSVAVRTGDRVRIEVGTDQPGYVTVFNVGPTGNLNVLYPSGPHAPSVVTAKQPLHVHDIELTPPAGCERVFALWTREPLALRPEELLGLAERGELAVSGPSRATRNMARVQQSLQQLPPGSWHVAVLELNHQPLEETTR
jgi:serine/threonine protein kinase